MDSNGYNPSIMPRLGECYICGRSDELIRHEIFGASNREKSKALGLWVNLCPRCHDAVHSYPKNHIGLKREAQGRAMLEYGWDYPDFIKKFGRSYL